jgi:DNA-binding LacI/PurR family transcriptional regulator
MTRSAEGARILASTPTPTIHDVAKLAGVGAATVSRVLNGTAPVTEATRKMVMDAIAELNYSPSRAARKLSLGKSFTISVISPFFTRPSFVERLRGIDHVLAQTEYDLVVFNVETLQKRDQYFAEVPKPDRTDGVIIVSLPVSDDDIAQFRRNNVPVVLVDSHHPALTSATEDSVQGGMDATEHLISLGHQRIAYISDILNDPLAHNYNASRNRLIGYRRALEQAGIRWRAEFQRSCHQDRASTRALAKEMLAQPNRPTAIFAASDTQALGILEAAHDLGLHVPEDLSVVGYDDIEIAEYVGLTTMHQALFASGQRGAELMLQTLEGKIAHPLLERLATDIVIRNTTCPPDSAPARVQSTRRNGKVNAKNFSLTPKSLKDR